MPFDIGTGFASLFFAAIVLATSRFATFERQAVLWMVLSSVLGIIFADTWWLVALKALGAKRLIAVDAIKPFVAAALGAAFLGDRIPPIGYAGVVATTLGVFLLNREEHAREPATEENAREPHDAELKDPEKPLALSSIQPTAIEGAKIESCKYLSLLSGFARFALCHISRFETDVRSRKRRCRTTSAKPIFC